MFKGWYRQLFTASDYSAVPESVNRRHRPDYHIVVYMSLLMLLGLIVMYAIGPQRANVLNHAYGTDYSESYFFVKQLTSLGIALGGFLLAAYIPFRVFTKNAKTLLYIGIGASALLAVADILNLGIAQESLGATRWFDLGPLGSFQPAELMKFAVLIFVAVFLGARVRQGKVDSVNETLMPLGLVVAACMVLVVVVQRDMGTGIALASIIAAMLVASGVKARTLWTMLIGAGVVGLLLIVTSPHRVDRVVTFFQGDSTSVEDAGSYHIEHAKIAIGSGGFMGVGIGNSVQATGYLPEAINDSVFAIMGETFGFIGLVAIMGLFTALLMRFLKVMDHLVDMRLKLIAAGVFGWFGAHVILNIASMVGIFPLTGITLPLLSFGGSSMIFIAAGIGLVFQLSHYTAHPSRIKEGQQRENSSSRRGVGRTRYSSSSYR